jgi:methanogenic corrinoid protein MtbC1
MRARGWRIYVGTDTPIASVINAVRTSKADLAVISAVNARSFHRCAKKLEQLFRLTGDPVEGAEQLIARVRGVGVR